jgi:hypothetical protein
MNIQQIRHLPLFSGPKDEKQARSVKRWLRIGGIVFAALVLILILLPLFINVNSFRPKVESGASAALGRQAWLSPNRMRAKGAILVFLRYVSVGPKRKLCTCVRVGWPGNV